MEHSFTPTIIDILRTEFGSVYEEIFEKSQILQYLNIKTKSAGQGSKSRAAFGKHYALYVLIEDYINKDFIESKTYTEYAGAKFSDLLIRQRQMPFGSKLQNHDLNNRLNSEFLGFFRTRQYEPILRDSTNRYWINENLLLIAVSDGSTRNIAKAVIKIIDAYIDAKRNAFDAFYDACRQLQSIQADQPEKVQSFITGLLQPKVDARLFEIVTFSILKASYGTQSIYWGWNSDDLQQESLILYKTGRTNANDGGIDFVMKPLGRFFQVTETVDVNKYFLDIDKVQKFPLTFVVKSEETVEALWAKIRQQAEDKYPVKAVVERYMACIEEVVNIAELIKRFDEVVKSGGLLAVLNEIVLQSTVEFNYEETNEDAEKADEEEMIIDAVPEPITL